MTFVAISRRELMLMTEIVLMLCFMSEESLG